MTPRTRIGASTLLLALGATALTGCGSDDNGTPSAGGSSTSAASSKDCASGTLSGAGSTFQQNIMAQWIKDYQAACSGTTVDYQGIGSGAGIAQFTAGTIDFAGSDATMKPEEQTPADKRCGGEPAIHLPITAGGLALVYNLPGVDELNLSAETVSGIFQGTITKWDDKAIKADNPDADLKSTPIQAFHRSDASGSTKIFSGWLDAAAGGDWKLGVDKELTWPKDGQGAKGSDGVASAVADTEGAIGYDEVSFADANDLSVAKVKNGAGEFAELTADSVTAAVESAKLPTKGNNVTMSFDYTTKAKGAYPVTGFSYEIVCSKGTKAATLPLLKEFLTYAVTDGQSSAEDLGYAPLPTSIVTRVKAAIADLS